jgi:hypothetical protein
MQITIKSATVVMSAGTDLVILETDLPPAVWPFEHQPSPRFEVAKGFGEQYVKDNFGLEPEVIDTGR